MALGNRKESTVISKEPIKKIGRREKGKEAEGVHKKKTREDIRLGPEVRGRRKAQV